MVRQPLPFELLANLVDYRSRIKLAVENERLRIPAISQSGITL
jgi:hypothetical protein